MKLTFICGSLEPEADGVGDYTRLLARKISSLEHRCQLLALNDFKLPPEAGSFTTDEEAGMQVVRLSPKLSWTDRMKEAQRALDAFGPDWVSLQFVCFAFHPKGIPWGLGERLLPLRKNRRMHIMFHELWLGEERGESLKFRIWGQLQKRVILQLIRTLNPDVIHTHASAYIKCLARSGISVRKLPLFSNIPEIRGDGWSMLQTCAGEQGMEFPTAQREKLWLGGIFGIVHPEWKAEPLFSHLKEAARLAGKHWIIVAFGVNKKPKEWWVKLSRHYSPDLSIIPLGPLPAESVSAILQILDFGFATSPWRLIDKSSSATAMLEYGLPLIVSRLETSPEIFSIGESPFADQIIPMDENLSHRMPALCKQKYNFQLPAVAEEFLQALMCCNPSDRRNQKAEDRRA